MTILLRVAGPLTAALLLLLPNVSTAQPAGLIQPKEFGPNGLDLAHDGLRRGLPAITGTALSGGEGGRWTIDERDLANGPFNLWFGRHAHVGAPEVFGHLVRCAYPRGATVVYGALTWHGRFGLARDPAKPLAGEDDRRWVSACLAALANPGRSHQVVSLRGGPLPVSAEEAFALGYPEGVFFGDLFAPPAQPVPVPPVHALSANLPAGYDPVTAGWKPPNVALGRTVDFEGAAWAAYGGRCQDRAGWFGGAAPAEAVCPGGAYTSGCAPMFRPLTVYGLRLANLEEPWDAARDPSRRSQLLRVGLVPPASGACGVPGGCVGSHDPMKPAAPYCGWEGDRAPAAPRSGSVRLGAGARVEAVLRDLDGKVKRGAAFTALVRFRTGDRGQPPPAASRTEVLTRGLGASQFVARKVRWGTLRQDGGFAWLEVYPVYLQEEVGRRGGPLVLDVRLAGKGASRDAPELDAVGFIPGPPSCCQEPGAPGWCEEVSEGSADGGVCPAR